MNVLNQLSIKSLYMLSVVAESQNLQQAASKLCVSPSALSHQMQRLEEKTGKPLFYREGRHQKLYPESLEWARRLNEDFINIEKSTKNFIDPKNNVIHLGVPSAFAFNRITPALGLWLQKHPDIDVRVRMLNCGDDPTALNLDVILSSPVKNKYYEQQIIVDEKYIPVCSKLMYEKLFSKNQKLFDNATPLLELSNVESWQAWRRFFSFPIEPRSMIYFSHTILLLQAVLSHQGVALLDYYLIKDQLEDGSLIQLSEEPMILDGLVHSISLSKNKKGDVHLLELKEWLNSFFT